MHIRDFVMKASGESGTGVIAQEVKQIHPEMVHMGSNGYYTVDMPNPWKLVKAIQEQEHQILEQQSEINELKETITRLAKQNTL